MASVVSTSGLGRTSSTQAKGMNSMLTWEISQSVERTLITLGVITFVGVILIHFGLTTESITFTLPLISPVMAYWFAGQIQQSSQERKDTNAKKNDQGGP